MASYQKCVYYVGTLRGRVQSDCKILNHDAKVFKPALKDYYIDFLFNWNLIGSEHITK